MGKTKNNTIKKRKSKQILVFDEHLRKDYLTGFSRRKQHRKQVAREEIKSRATEAKRLVKEKYRELMKQSLNTTETTIADTPQEAASSVYDLPDHTVTVTDVTYVDMSGADGLMLGHNTFESDEDDVKIPSVESQPVQCIMKSLRGELSQIEQQTQKKKKKRSGKPKRKGPLKKGTHRRRCMAK